MANRAVSSKADRLRFDSGQPALDEWLKQRAGQFDRRDLSRTYVATIRASPTVIGYYALSAHHVRYESLPSDQAKGLPKIDLPVILLGRLAVDRAAQGQGLGSLMLIDALGRTQRLADEVGIRALEVDAIDDAARDFYIKYGFVQLLDDKRHLFLPMQVIRKLKLNYP
jgi:GNAT superfamily N-acetyltransferase